MNRIASLQQRRAAAVDAAERLTVAASEACRAMSQSELRLAQSHLDLAELLTKQIEAEERRQEAIAATAVPIET